MEWTPLYPFVHRNYYMSVVLLSCHGIQVVTANENTLEQASPLSTTTTTATAMMMMSTYFTDWLAGMKYSIETKALSVQPNVWARCRPCGPTFVFVPFTKVNLDTSIAYSQIHTHNTTHNNHFLILDFRSTLMSERASVYVFNDSLIINKIVFGPQPSSHIYSLTATAATMAKRNNFINEPTQDILFFSRLKNFGLDLNRMQIVHTFVLFKDSFEREFNNSKRTKMSRILIVQAKILPARAFIADRNNWYGAVREYAMCVWVCESVCVAFIWDACTTLDTKREIQFVCKCRYTMFDMHQIVEAKVERDTLRQREGAWDSATLW